MGGKRRKEGRGKKRKKAERGDDKGEGSHSYKEESARRERRHRLIKTRKRMEIDASASR